MTTQKTVSENALLNALDQNIPMHKFLSAYVDQIFILHTQDPAQPTNKGPCKIYDIEAAKQNPASSESVSEFDNFIESLEADPENAKQLSQARQWVSETFYNDKPTLASLRLAAGLSQSQLGLNCDIQQSHVSRYESGKHEPLITIAKKMANALNVDLEVFFQAWSNTRETIQSGEGYE